MAAIDPERCAIWKVQPAFIILFCAVQRYHFRPSLQRVEIVRPLLHHTPALGEVLRVVVGGADLVAFVMGKLAFDAIGMEPHFV